MGKNKNKLPDMLSKEQLIRLFESIPAPKTAIACFTALVCGLRVREVCRLEISDINLEKNMIKIKDSKNPNRGKQGYGKDRYIPLPIFAISPIKKWLDIIQGGKWFLPSNKSPDMPLRTKTLHEWFKEARKRAGLNDIDYIVYYKKTNPCNKKDIKPIYKFRFHNLRHYYAQYIYDRTRDIYSLSRLLGHSRIDTTTIYAKCSEKVLRESVDFAFNNPVRTKIFEQNPINALNYVIPPIAKRDKSPIEILEERFAKGEISAIDYQASLRLLKVTKDLFEDKNNNEINKYTNI